MAKNTFKSFINEYYYDLIFEKIENYISTHPSFIREQINDEIRVNNTELEDFTIEAVYVEDKGKDGIDFDIVCKCDVDYEFIRYVKRRADHDSDVIGNIWVVVHGSSHLNSLKKAKIYDVEPYEKNRKQKPLNGDMVPVICANEYSKYAHDIIKEYYGEDYDFNKPIHIRELANRMGLSVKELHPEFSFSKDKAIFGQIYFDETKAQFYNKKKDVVEEHIVPGNTILYDSQCTSVFSLGSIDITIAHECVHYALHKKAFLFSKFINNSDITYISCLNSGVVQGVVETNQNESYMEAQANGIAPYLIMPEETFKKSACKLYNSYKQNSEPIEFMDAVINSLRNKFNVTIPAVKKRLRDLGFLDGIGVLEWDRDKNRYIDAYTYKKDSLSKDETYSITLSDFQRAFFDSRNLKLLATILNDNFIYVDGHVVFNDEDYVFLDDFGDPVLTEYAKRHMDECALKFKILNKNVHLSDKNIGTFCYLCKGIADDMSFDLILEANPAIIKEGHLKEKRNKHEQVQKEVIRIIQDSPNLKECMNALVERYEYLPKEFASHGIQAGTYSRYVNGQVEKLDIRKAICLCHAFKFTPLVANEFIRKFSKEGLGTDDEGNALFMVVTSLRTWNIKKINQYLIDQGFKPLSS